MNPSRLGLGLLAVLAGCGTHPTAAAPVDAAVGGDADLAETSTGADEGGLVAACGSPDATSALPCGTLEFAKSSVVSRPRNHHVTLTTPVASGGWMLYTLAGANADAAIAYVDRVPVAADGTLGTWVTESPLPVASAGAVGEIVSGVIVVAGGTTPSETTDQAYSAVIQADGSLAAWKPAGSVVHPRMHGGAVVQGSTMWILGGFDNETVWSDIVSATVAPDGTVSTWKTAGALPGPRSHFSITQLDDFIYITAGLAQSAFDDPSNLQDSWVGQIQPDGTIGGWKQLENIPVALATHASFFYGGSLYLCGGITDTAESAACWNAPVQPDHTLGAFQTVASLPIARGHVHQMPVLGNHVYSIAGATDFNLDSTTQIDVGTFTLTPSGMFVAPPAPVATPAARSLRPGAMKCHAKGSFAKHPPEKAP